jgi:hypothetical protein
MAGRPLLFPPDRVLLAILFELLQRFLVPILFFSACCVLQSLLQTTDAPEHGFAKILELAGDQIAARIASEAVVVELELIGLNYTATKRLLASSALR